MMRLLGHGICGALLVLLIGCAAPSSPQAQASDTATCYVCRYNNDLACVDVHVKENTPRSEYAGKTYCFCSQGCKTAFVKAPEKYLPR